ncbi:MAG: Nif3-like dinuclear metal center hexameric protein [Clostridiales bacterium]|jgi:putative NIF3 family GTP cyclohydrolase 1 type 2|nr:Nif3-like dinuclear metal center hexameric protein [Clostridiales bacterium]
MTVQQVIDAIIKRADIPFKLERTCDVLICGNPTMEVKGIVTSFMATVDVIRQAHKLGANMIITHEPTWFCGADDTDWLTDDPVYTEKKRLIEDTGIAIWRYHDHMHMRKPDEIYEGLDKELDWGQYARPGVEKTDKPIDFAADFGHYYDIPETTVRGLAEELKAKLGLVKTRIVGSPDMACSRVGILAGGGSLGLGDEKMPARAMGIHGIHVMVCGDVYEWTLPAYVNDAAQLGHRRALIIAGHERSEEWGMKHMAGWLRELAQAPVTFVDAKDPYIYL